MRKLRRMIAKAQNLSWEAIQGKRYGYKARALCAKAGSKTSGHYRAIARIAGKMVRGEA